MENVFILAASIYESLFMKDAVGRVVLQLEPSLLVPWGRHGVTEDLICVCPVQLQNIWFILFAAFAVIT